MASLGGRFAGILQVAVAPERVDALTTALSELGPAGMRVIVEDSDALAEDAGKSYRIELIGNDQPNIVRRISNVLAEQNVTVLELSSECAAAPMAGGNIFKMHASIQCPTDVDRAALRESLEDVANSLMVDIQLDD